MTDDWGREITEIRSDLKALDKRVVKTEKWCEQDSPEFHRQMQDFVTSYRAVEAEREKVATQRHQENSTRLETIKTRSDIWNVVLAGLGLICAICMLYLSIKAAGHAENDPSKIFHSENPEPNLSQNSTLPQTYQPR